MAVPDFQSLMLPALEAIAHSEVTGPELRQRVAEKLQLSQEDLTERLPRGSTTVFANRVAWANVYLQRAGLIEKTGNGKYRSTETGLTVLAEHPSLIDLAYLHRFPSYTEWRRGLAPGEENGSESIVSPEATRETVLTPEEQIAKNFAILTTALQADVLAKVRDMSPGFFERLVVDLLVKLGYGGGQPEMGQVTGKSGDGGIDGIIKEDALGLDIVYLQAKRYGASHSVGHPGMRDFAGSLDGEGATKGIFITTGTFSPTARDYVSRIPKRIILVDGLQLAALMVEREVGVRVSDVFKVKKIDENYFTEA
jgi:restriction system protein